MNMKLVYRLHIDVALWPLLLLVLLQYVGHIFSPVLPLKLDFYKEYEVYGYAFEHKYTFEQMSNIMLKCISL